MRRYSLKSARDVRELIRIAEHLKGGLSVLELPGFFAALAATLDAMLAIGPRASTPETDLLIARMEAAKATRPGRPATAA